jgi:hypothetical protein
VEAIADAIDAILKSTNVNLSEQQIAILKNMTDQEKLVYNQADSAITLGKIPADWRQSVANVAKTVVLLVQEARRGIELYKAGKNMDQEAILDFPAIDNLIVIVEKTKAVYTKIDAYVKTIPGHVSMDAKEQLLMRHPAPHEALLVFGK